MSAAHGSAPGGARGSAGRRGAASFVAPAVVLAATALAFLPILQNRFVNWDDYQNLGFNPSYRGLGAAQLRWMFTTFHLGHYQPLAWVTLGADYLVWGMNPAGYHLTSLLFHLANTLLVYRLALRLLAGSAKTGPAPEGAGATLAIAAAFTAGLFALHPLRVESVAWATARRDVVSAFFCLLSILAYLRAVDEPGGQRWRVASIAAFALAILSKEIVATLPALLLLLDVYPLRRLRSDASGRASETRSARVVRLLVEKIPYFALSAAITIVGFAGQRATQAVPGLREYGLLDRAAIAAYGLAFYVRKTILPTSLSPAHVIPADFRADAAVFVVSAVIVLAAAVGLAIAARRHRWPAAIAAALAYAISLSPVLGIVQVWRQIVAERYSYLACLGFALLGGGALLRWAAHRGAAAVRFATLSAAALLLLLGIVTARQARVWRDPEILWRSALRADPRNYLALYNLGVEMIQQGRYAQAKEAYAAALALQPNDSETLGGLGALALNEGRLDEAGAYLEQAVALDARNAIALTNLGIYRSRRGDRDGAEAAYRGALALKPDNAEAIGSLGGLALSAGRLDEAVGYLERSVALWPQNALAFTNLGILRLRLGERDRAIEALSRATRLMPSFAEAWKNLGVAHEGAGRSAESAAAFREYVLLRPDDRDAQRSLVSNLLRAGDEAAAAAAARENLARDSTDWASANMLAWVLATAADGALRDPQLAIRMAEGALASESAASGSGAETLEEPDANLLDTYATALAAAGRFDEAVGAARRAARLAALSGDSTLAREAGERLALFEARTPYRARAPGPAR